MRVVLTRAVHEAERWSERLHERGIEAIVRPLLAIAAAPDQAALRAAAQRADDYAAVMFVRAHAVQAFLAAQPVFARARAWAPGPATQEALRAAGVDDARIAAPALDAVQFDSEALWQQVGGQVHAGDRILVVRGGAGAGRAQGRGWLLQQLAEHGVAADTVVAYTRTSPRWNDAQRAAAQAAAGDGSLWLFSSAEAAGYLASLVQAKDWSRARALATHPRIVHAVRALGFGMVRPSRPGWDDVLASIESSR